MAEKNDDVAEIKSAAKGSTTPTDTILAVSRHQDGSPAQSPGFTSVNPDATKAISEQQLREHAVSAVDHAIRSAQAEADSGEPHEDPVNKALREAHEAAAAEGEKKAKAESY